MICSFLSGSPSNRRFNAPTSISCNRSVTPTLPVPTVMPQDAGHGTNDRAGDEALAGAAAACRPAIPRHDSPASSPRETSSRSAGESRSADRGVDLGLIPPVFANNRCKGFDEQ